MKYIFRILRSAKELWRYYALISLFTIMLSVFTLILPFLSGLAIDEITKGTDASVKYVAFLAAIMFLVDLSHNLFSNISGYLGDQMTEKLRAILSNRYYKHILSLPQQYFDTELSGKVISRLNRSIEQIIRFMHMMSNNFLQFIFGTLLSLFVVALYSWQVALMLFALYPIYIIMTFRSSGKWQRYQAKKNEHIDIASGRFAEAINQVKVVKSFIQENREQGFFARHMGKVVAITKPQSRYWHTKDVQRRVILNLIFFAVYMFIFVQGARGEFTPGQAVALILYAAQIRIPIFTISFLVENTQKAIADSKDYFEILDEKPSIQDKSGAKPLKVKGGKIDFNNVDFSYDKGKKVLQGINLTIEPGTKVALVGESGEGKTTLTNLLLRLYEPQNGTIKIDDQDITKATQKSLRQNVGVVFQDPALFSGTIKENIGYANANASENAIIKAAKAANAHEFIKESEHGYDSQIGERGLKLSGGQKQRIAIARALLKDAPILVLDEATSSLDSKSESMVQQALQHLMKGRTTIIIAHRLSTIENVDQIITISKGKISEIGAPQELAKSGGMYSQLLALQNKHTKTSNEQLESYDIKA